MPRERNTDYERSAVSIANKCKDGKWKLYLIAAEGDRTEPHYFTTFQAKYKSLLDKTNLHVEFIDRKEPAKSSPRYVDETLIEFCEILVKNYDLKEDYDELWLIIDTDEYDNRKNIISELIKKCDDESLYHLALSNPCFEIWLMLHFTDLDCRIKDYIKDHSEDCSIKAYIESIGIKGRPKACKRLLSMIHKNPKDLYERLIERIDKAISGAKKLDDCNPDKDKYPKNICTDVYKLLEKLIEQTK